MNENGFGTAIAVDVDCEADQKSQTKRQPQYHVVLWDDDDHSYDYVILMMRKLFGHNFDSGFSIAKHVDNSGRAVCWTTTKEHAEFKRDQIHSFGKDMLIECCGGSMSATIEPVPSEA